MSRRLQRMLSLILATALLIPSGLMPVAAAAAGPVTIFHETFANYEVQSGGASLTRVTGVAFDGNADGAALYVSNRTNNWDGADFNFSAIGLEHGETYTITASIYVDDGVTVPAGAQAYLQLFDSYAFLKSADFVAGSSSTLAATFTVDAFTDSALRFQSSANGASVPFYIGDILITDESEERVFRETFADYETRSGGASLTRVNGVVFDGNADGAALHVSDRTNNWDAVDFNYSAIGLQNGQTYTVTASVYVADDVIVPAGAGAEVLMIDDNNYNTVVSASLAAGAATTLTAQFTVDTSTGRALRFQSNAIGASVPFYIGDVRITGQLEEEVRPPALNFATITFEDQALGGFMGRSGTESITVTNEANHTPGGSYALKVENRSQNWHGPTLRVEQYVDKGYEYRISLWVKLISPASSQLQLSTQVGSGSSANYVNLSPKTISTNDGWVQYEGTYRYNNVGGEYLTIYVESSNNSTASFYIDDISFVRIGGPVTIQEDLTPIKQAYADEFLIGTAISVEDLEGVRLDLMNMHYNVATAGNAMKPDALQRDKGVFTFTAADAMVDTVRDAGMYMHGHVLVWHQQSPNWMHTSSGDVLLDREEALDNMRTHIQTVMEHFGDRVIAWDVVNEAMNDNPTNPSNWEGALRQSAWYRSIGPDYVEQAFLAAREVLDANPDWDIKLYYNDYNEDNQNKALAISNMVQEINDRYALTNPGKLLIDGVGMQGHYNINTNPNNVRLSLERFISLGVEISITELDVQAGQDYELTEQLANQQAYLYAQLFQLFKDNAEHIKRVTFWGLDDNTSWRAANSPLLFDKDLQAKPSYYAVIDPDTFIANYQPVVAQVNQATAVYGTPVIDGTIDSVWNKAPKMRINKYQMAWQGASGIARALWDSENLYVLVQVSDNQLDKGNSEVHQHDSVEVFLDENNAKTSSYQEDDGQYRVNFDNETSFGGSTNATGFESATSISGTNYTVELKIPFKSITPSKRTKLGFDVQINDASNGSRQSVAAWNDTTGTGYIDPSVFGVLNLANTVTIDEELVEQVEDTKAPEEEAADTGARSQITISGGRVINTLSADSLNQALEQATATANGKKEIVIDIPEQENAVSYEVQLPTAGLNSQDSYVLLVKTANAELRLPSSMLSNVPVRAEQVSIRVSKANADKLDAAAREQVGTRPVIELHLVADDTVIAWSNPNAPVTVAIPYTPTAEELSNPDHIVIWYIDGHGQAIAVPNGRYDAASGTVVFRTTHFSTYAVASVFKTFGDLASVPWAQQAIGAMAARDVIQGTSASSYTPAAPIKRADFIALLVRALELQGTGFGGAMFSDVPATAYYYNEVAVAKELGIAAGYADNTLLPDSAISRQDMMVLTIRALAAAGKLIAGDGDLDAYPDAASVAPYARASAAGMVRAGVISGKNGNLAPNDPLTRAEAAVILHQIWKL